ncbi:MAG: rubrerythrin family protein [Caldithrix sp. RBG_13_44_9]|nr:MAG: rubrerythrin family protein [Caldithrix sp. RBG_13_44_9]
MKILRMFQRNEITEYHVYQALARRVGGKNSEILQKIADDELRHYHGWKSYTNLEIKPNRFLVFLYLLLARILGLTFAIKMMEHGEVRAEQSYAIVESIIPEASQIIKEENEHENLLVEMIDEERINYIGSMVLGLNDALVELTGALAGFTLALQNTRLIGLAGLITGIAASLSMAASEYLSQKSEKEGKDPLRASFYTGIAYIVAVILLVMPYFLLTNYYTALGFTLIIAILIILAFAQFVSVVKGISFKKFFWEMVLISLGVATISFFVGWAARSVLHV